MVSNWVWWIVVDVVYIPLLISQGLAVTAVVYVAFLGLSIAGLRGWRSRLAVQAPAGSLLASPRMDA